jgi:DNA excision repair protein ERCC-4
MKKKIHNIFSNKKEEKEITANTKIPIIIDTREKQSLVFSKLYSKKSLTNFEKLDIGDYLVGDTIIERKTFSDLQASIIDKRLITQLKEMKKYPKQILLLEGFIYNYSDSRINENAIRGLFLSISLDFKTPIIFTEDEEDTSKFLITLAKRYEKEKVQTSDRQIKTAKNIEEQKRFILEGFPGIGPTTSKQLFEKFKTLHRIFNLEEKELIETKLLDEKKIKKFLELLRT